MVHLLSQLDLYVYITNQHYEARFTFYEARAPFREKESLAIPTDSHPRTFLVQDLRAYENHDADSFLAVVKTQRTEIDNFLDVQTEVMALQKLVQMPARRKEMFLARFAFSNKVFKDVQIYKVEDAGHLVNSFLLDGNKVVLVAQQRTIVVDYDYT